MNFFTTVLLVSLFSLSAFSAVRNLSPSNVVTASGKKTNHFIKEGIITGGDRMINDVIVLDIRHGGKGGFERIVLDVEGNHQGEPVAVERPPYYQVRVSPIEKMLVYTVWGGPKLAFDPKKVLKAFKKSRFVKKVELYPILELSLIHI